MRLALAALVMPLLAGTAAAQSQAERPADRQLVLPEPPQSPGAAECRDRIETVRAANGRPLLDRDNARPEQADGLLLYAVQRRIDGCDVLVMAGDPGDVRPLPRFEADDWRVRPAPHRAQ